MLLHYHLHLPSLALIFLDRMIFFERDLKLYIIIHRNEIVYKSIYMPNDDQYFSFYLHIQIHDEVQIDWQRMEQQDSLEYQ